MLYLYVNLKHRNLSGECMNESVSTCRRNTDVSGLVGGRRVCPVASCTAGFTTDQLCDHQ